MTELEAIWEEWTENGHVHASHDEAGRMILLGNDCHDVEHRAELSRIGQALYQVAKLYVTDESVAAGLRLDANFLALAAARPIDIRHIRGGYDDTLHSGSVCHQELGPHHHDCADCDRMHRPCCPTASAHWWADPIRCMQDHEDWPCAVERSKSAGSSLMKYLSRAIMNPDGRSGHYGDTVAVSEVADDYGRLTVAEFDAKYPGWSDDHAFKTALQDEFHRRDLEQSARQKDA